VKNPMNWDKIKEKLDLHAYGTVEEFKVRTMPWVFILG
jgi:hypothetical protein